VNQWAVSGERWARGPRRMGACRGFLPVSSSVLPGLLAIALAGCPATGGGDVPPSGHDSDTSAPASSFLDGPEGIRVVGDRVFVTSTCAALDDATGTMTYGPGYLSALAPETLEETGRVDVPWLNPQTLVVIDGQPERGGETGAPAPEVDGAGDGQGGSEDGFLLAVVCSGRLESDRNGRMLAATPGGILLVRPETLAVVGQTEIPIGTPGSLGGFPGTAVFDPAGNALLAGSGIGPYVYRVSLAPPSVADTFTVHPESETNDLVVPALAGGILYVSSQRTGLLYRLDPASGIPVADPLDITKTDAYEGPIDIAVTGDTLYVLATISSRVAAVDLATGQVTWPFSAGSAPNRLLFHEGMLYAVNSLDNNLTRYDPATGQRTSPFAPLPVGTNPWEIAAAGTTGYITGYLDDTVYAVSLDDGAILRTSR